MSGALFKLTRKNLKNSRKRIEGTIVITPIRALVRIGSMDPFEPINLWGGFILNMKNLHDSKRLAKKKCLIC